MSDSTAPSTPQRDANSTQRRKGVIFGLTAYFLWGLFPLYWPLLKPASAGEILAARIVFSLVFVLIILAVTKNWSWIRPVFTNRRTMGLLTIAAILIAINWGVYIYAVTTGQVIQGSLGYFANPIVTIGLGVFLLHERLRRMQWVAVGLGIAALVVLTFGFGGVPWIAMVLAFSFAFYGFTKKTVGMGAVESLTVETAVLFLPAIAYMIWLEVSGKGSLFEYGAGHALMMTTTGVATAIPLLFFGGAATRVPLSWVGIMQYLGPIMQFLIGYLVLHEPMTTARWIGFGLVWIACIILTLDSLNAVRRGRHSQTDVADEIAEDAAEAH